MALNHEYETSPILIPAYKLDLKPKFIKSREVVQEYDQIVRILDEVN